MCLTGNSWSALSLAVLLFTVGCTRDRDDNTASKVGPDTSAAKSEVVATIGNDQITMDDVRGLVGEQLDQLEAGYVRQRDKTIEATTEKLVWDRVIAAEVKKRNKTVDELLAAESSGSLDPTPAEVRAWYTENSARVNQPFEQVQSQIVDMLKNQRRILAAMKLQGRLTAEHGVVMRFEPFRVAFQNDGAPTTGAANAPVTLVEFSDFQCPYCKGFVSTLQRLKTSHGNVVRVIYRQFPIPNLHPNAFKAAEASLCAHEQGKFWEMHDLMFAEQDKLTVSELKEKAVRLKINKAKFDNCLDTGRYVEQVQSDMKEGQKAGVSGTPALFLNGILVEGGAVPYEPLVALIEKEQARLRR